MLQGSTDRDNNLFQGELLVEQALCGDRPALAFRFRSTRHASERHLDQPGDPMC
jgi:hypothetical protein